MSIGGGYVGGLPLASSGSAVAFDDRTSYRNVSLSVVTAAPVAMTGNLSYSYNSTSQCSTASGAVTVAVKYAAFTNSGSGIASYNSCPDNLEKAWVVSGSVKSSAFGPSLTLPSSLSLSAMRGAYYSANWTAVLSGSASMTGLTGVALPVTVVVSSATSYSASLALTTTAGTESLALSAPYIYYSYNSSCEYASGYVDGRVYFTSTWGAAASGSVVYSTCSGSSGWSVTMNVADLYLGTVRATALTATASRTSSSSKWNVAVNGTGVLGNGTSNTLVSIAGTADQSSSTAIIPIIVTLASSASPSSPLDVYATGSLTFNPVSNCTSVASTAAVTAYLAGTGVSGSGYLSYNSCPTGSNPVWSLAFDVSNLALGPATITRATFTAKRGSVLPTGMSVVPWTITYAGTASLGSGITASLAGAVTSTTDYNSSGTLTLDVSTGKTGSAIALTGSGSFSYNGSTACASVSASVLASIGYGGSSSASLAGAKLAYDCTTGWAASFSSAGGTLGALTISTLAVSITAPARAATASDWVATLSGSGTISGSSDLTIAAVVTVQNGATSVSATVASADSSTSPLALSGSLDYAVTSGCSTASGSLTTILALGSQSFTQAGTVAYNSCGSPVWSVSGSIGSALAPSGLSSDVGMSVTSFTATRAASTTTWTAQATVSASMGSIATATGTVTITNKTHYTISGTGSLSSTAVTGVTVSGTVSAFTYSSATGCAAATASGTLALSFNGGYKGTGTATAVYDSCSTTRRWTLTAAMADALLGDVRISSVTATAVTSPTAPSTWALSGTGSASIGPATATVAWTAYNGTYSATATLSVSTSTFESSLTLTVPESYSGECVAISGCGSAKMLMGDAGSSATIPTVMVTYSPCTGSMSIWGTAAASLTVSGNTLTITNAYLSYSGGNSGVWSGTLAATATSGSMTGDLSVAFSGTGDVKITAGVVYLFAYGNATASVSGSTSCSTGYTTGTAGLALSNLPAGLPAVAPVTGVFMKACDGSGLWNASVSVPSFSIDLGPSVVTVSSPTLTLSNSNNGVAGNITVVFTGVVGSVTVSVTVATGTGTVTITGASTATLTVSSLYASLTGSSLALSGPSDIISPVTSASISGITMTADLTARSLSLTATVSSLFGSSSGTDFGFKLTGTKTSVSGTSGNATRSLKFSLVSSLSLGSMSSLPSSVKSLSTSGLSSPLMVFSNEAVSVSSASAVALKKASGAAMSFLPVSGISLQAPTITFQDVTVSDVTLVFTPISGGGATASGFSLSGTGTATIAGFTSGITFTRAPTGGFSSVYLGLSVSDSDWPFSFAGNMSYSNTTGTASGSGYLTDCRFTLGGRSMSLTSVSASVVTFSGKTWSITAPMPGGTFGGITVSSMTMTATRVYGGSWTFSFSGTATVGGVTVTLVVVYSGVGVYSATFGLAMSTSVVDFRSSFTVADSGPCTTLSGSVSSFSLNLRGDSVSIPSLAATYNSCTGGMSLRTSTATTFTTHGVSVSLTSLSLSRASKTSSWVGNLVASATEAVASEGYLTGTQSLNISFSESSVSKVLLDVALTSSDLTVAASLSLTHPSACATGGMNTATVAVAATVSSWSVTGRGTLSRSCAAATTSASKPWSISFTTDAALTLDMMGRSVTLASPTLGYDSASGTLSMIGTVSGAFKLGLSGSLKTRSYSITGSLAAPTTLNVMLFSLLGEVPSSSTGPVAELFSPVLQSVLSYLSVSVSVSGTTTKTYTLTYGALVNKLFGSASVGIAGQLSRTSGSLYWVLGVSMDLSAMDGALPGCMKSLASSLGKPSLNIGGGTPPAGTVTASTITLPTMSFSSKLPTLKAGVRGISLGGSMSLVGNALGTFVSAMGKTKSNIGPMLTSLGSAADITISVTSVTAFSASISISDSPISMGNGVVLSSLSLFMSLSPTTVSVGVSAAVTASLGSGGSSATLVGEGILMLQASSSGVLSLVMSVAVGMQDGTTKWVSPFGAGNNVAVLMPLSLTIGVGVADAVPFLTAFGFSGGASIANAFSAYAALSVNLADVSKTALAFTFSSETDSVSLLRGITGCSSCFPSESAVFLNTLMPRANFAISFNPSPTAVAIGPSAAPVYIPPGLTVSITKTWVYGIIYIKEASLSIGTGGMTAAITLGPLSFFGIVHVSCYSCSNSASGPSFRLSLTPKEQSFYLDGAIKFFNGAGGSAGVTMWASCTTHSYNFTAVATAGTSSVSVISSGYLDKPKTIALDIKLFLAPGNLLAAGADGLSLMVSNAAAATQQLDSATSGLASANAQLKSATDAVAAQQAVVDSAIASANAKIASANLNSLLKARDDLATKCRGFADSASYYSARCGHTYRCCARCCWGISVCTNCLYGPEMCVQLAYYSAARDGCWVAYYVADGAYQTALAGVSAATASLTWANTAATATLNAAKAAVSSATALVSTAQTTLNSAMYLVQSFSNLATQGLAKFSDAMSGAFSVNSLYLSFSLKGKMIKEAIASVYVTINSKLQSFSLTLPVPLDIATVAKQVAAWGLTFINTYIMTPKFNTILAALKTGNVATLVSQGFRRQLQTGDASVDYGLPTYATAGLLDVTNGTTALDADAVQVSYLPTADMPMYYLDPDTPVVPTYNNVSGVYEIGEFQYHLDTVVNGTVDDGTAWYPCTTCATTKVDDSATAVATRRRLAENERNVHARALAAAASNDAAALEAIYASQANNVAVTRSPGTVTAIQWSGNGNLTKLCSYMSNVTRSVQLSNIALKLYVAGNDPGLGTPPSGGAGGALPPPPGSSPLSGADGDVYFCFQDNLQYLTDLTLTNVTCGVSLLDFAFLAPNLRSLSIGSSDITGSLTKDFITRAPNITYLRVTDAPLTGNLLWMKDTYLTHVQIKSTRFSDDRLPEILSDMPYLAYSRVEGNDLVSYSSAAVQQPGQLTRLEVTGYISNPQYVAMCGLQNASNTPQGGTDVCSQSMSPFTCAQDMCGRTGKAIAGMFQSAVTTFSAGGMQPLSFAPVNVAKLRTGGAQLLPLRTDLWAFRLALSVPRNVIPPDSTAVKDTATALNTAATSFASTQTTALNTLYPGASFTGLRFRAACPVGRMGPDCTIFCGSSWAAYSTNQVAMPSGTVGPNTLFSSMVLVDGDTGATIPRDTSAASVRSLQERCLVPTGCGANNCSVWLTTMFSACDSLLLQGDTTYNTACAYATVMAETSCGVGGALTSPAVLSSSTVPDYCKAPVLGVASALAKARWALPPAGYTIPSPAAPTPTATATSTATKTASRSPSTTSTPSRSATSTATSTSSSTATSTSSSSVTSTASATMSKAPAVTTATGTTTGGAKATTTGQANTTAIPTVSGAVSSPSEETSPTPKASTTSTASSTSLAKPSASGSTTPSFSPGASPSGTPSGTPSPSSLPPQPVFQASLLFTPPANVSFDESSFTEDVKAALQLALEASLGVEAGTVKVTGVEPVYADEPTVPSAVRRLLGHRTRSLQARVVVGYRIVLAIVADAVSRSTVVGGATTGGASLATSLSSAVTRVTNDGTLASNLVSANPSALASLGYTSVSQFSNSVSLDPTRQVTTVARPLAPPQAKGLSAGSAAAIAVVLVVVAVVGAAAGYYYRFYKPNQAAKSTVATSSDGTEAGQAAIVSKIDSATGDLDFQAANPIAGRARFSPTAA